VKIELFNFFLYYLKESSQIMAEADKTNMFREFNKVSSSIPSSSNAINNQEQSNVSHQVFFVRKTLGFRCEWWVLLPFFHQVFSNFQFRSNK
jgi:hypothetical protein